MFPFSRFNNLRNDLGDSIKNVSPKPTSHLVVSANESLLNEPSFIDFNVVVADRPSEWNHIANLRYNEWIENKFTTSREAFRLATLEICEERCSQGAVIVVAKDSENSEVLGAAEASPIEMKAAKLPIQSLGMNDDDMIDFYVTDVITAERHRRKGVARCLIQALEKEADYLWLHVASENHPAQEFYKGLGYGLYSALDQDESRIDTKKLEEVSGSVGQLLMWKKIASH